MNKNRAYNLLLKDQTIKNILLVNDGRFLGEWANLFMIFLLMTKILTAKIILKYRLKTRNITCTFLDFCVSV